VSGPQARHTLSSHINGVWYLAAKRSAAHGEPTEQLICRMTG